MILVVHFSLGGVRNMRIRAKNLRHLHKSPVKLPGMLDQVALQKTDPTAINPVGHPIAGDGGLLLPINQNLLLPETEQSILLDHRPTHIVLLARAATISPLNPHNLDSDARRVGWLVGHRTRRKLYVIEFFFVKNDTPVER
jgi:hypothetical protein